MNKKVVVVAGLLVVVGALAFAGVSYAQTPTPPGTPGYGYGMMGGYGRGFGPGDGTGYGAGMQGHMWNAQDGDTGPLHDAMQNAIAEALGLTPAELDSRIAAGETPYQIAQAQGLTQQEFAQAMATARQSAIKQAAADGQITQEQADWMLAHVGGRGGRFGQGQGYGDCPMFDQDAGADA
jgi:hypothetical protein